MVGVQTNHLQEHEGLLHPFTRSSCRASDVKESKNIAYYKSAKVQALAVADRLKEVFKIPKPIILYTSGSPIAYLGHIHNTALQVCLLRPDFWILLAFHILIVVLYFGVYHYETLVTSNVKGIPTAKDWPTASYTLLSLPGGLITFALVFYIQQTYKRWFDQYSHVKGGVSQLGELIVSLRIHFPDSDNVPKAKETRSHLANLLNAAHVLAYAGLPQNRYEGIHVWAFDFCLEQQLLTVGQVEVLKEMLLSTNGRMAFKEVLLWVTTDIWNLVDMGRLDPKVGNYLHNQVFAFQKHIDTLYDFTAGPIPFAYYHHLNLITYSYLIMLGYVFAFSSHWMSIVGYVMVLFGFISMREIGNIMSDPLGNDDMDLPVFDLVLGGVKCFTKLINLPPSDSKLAPFDSSHSRLQAVPSTVSLSRNELTLQSL